MKLRRLFETDLAASWTAAIVAKRLAMSEATLRRRLAAEGTTLGIFQGGVTDRPATPAKVVSRFPKL
jgi:AraC-like DNA-binding protein